MATLDNQKKIRGPASSTFADWCQMTTLNGVHDFYRSNNVVLKMLWFVIVITGCFIATNQCVDFILDYAFEEQWITNVYRQIPPDDEFQWPQLRVCYKNKIEAYDWSRSNESIGPYELAFISSKNQGINFYREFQDSSDEANASASLWDIENRVVRDEPIVLDSWKNVCRRTVVHCGPNVGFTSYVGCNCSSFAAPSSHRDCFILNLSDIQKDHIGYQDSSYESGLMVLLNPRTNAYQKSVLYSDKLSSGLNLYIHFDGEENARYSKPILAGSGTHVLISMQIELHRTLPRRSYTFQFSPRQPDCITRFAYRWLSTTFSSRTLCRQDCFTEIAIKHCKCVSMDSSLPLKGKFRICNETEEESCQRDISQIRKNKVLLPCGFNLSRCFDECKEPCEYKEIATDISLAPFPARKKIAAFTKYLNKASLDRSANFSEEQVEQMTLVELFFESKEYKVMDRVPKVTLEGLISDIGGTLGVWTGLSLIGIFQGFMYAFYGIQSFCCNKKSNQKKWKRKLAAKKQSNETRFQK